MSNICFYFTCLTKSSELRWAKCFNELAYENSCSSFVIFDTKKEFDSFDSSDFDRTFPFFIDFKNDEIESLTNIEMNEIISRYSQFNIQQLQFHEFKSDKNLKNFTFLEITCAYIKRYEAFIIENEVEVIFFMEPQSLNMTANTIIMEMVCNFLEKKIRLAHCIGGWTNIGIFDNLHRSSEKINKLYRRNLLEGLTHKEEKKLLDYFKAYEEFKASDYANKIIYKKTLNKNFSSKVLIKNVINSIENLFTNNLKFNQGIYENFDINNNKYVLFLPNKVNNKRARYLSPFYSNHLSIVESILLSLPSNYFLVIKDHPHSMIGNIDVEMVKLAKNSSNCIYLDPSLSTFEVIEAADIVISVASTSVIEALIKFKHVIMFGKKIFTFGETDAPIKRVTNIEDLPMIMNDCVNSSPPVKEIKAFFHALLSSTYRAGDVSDENWSDFSNRDSTAFDKKRVQIIKEAVNSAKS